MLEKISIDINIENSIMLLLRWKDILFEANL